MLASELWVLNLMLDGKTSLQRRLSYWWWAPETPGQAQRSLIYRLKYLWLKYLLSWSTYRALVQSVKKIRNPPPLYLRCLSIVLHLILTQPRICIAKKIFGA